MSTHTIRDRDVDVVDKRLERAGWIAQVISFLLGVAVGSGVAAYVGVPFPIAAVQALFFGCATLTAALFITNINRQATVEHVKNKEGTGETND